MERAIFELNIDTSGVAKLRAENCQIAGTAKLCRIIDHLARYEVVEERAIGEVQPEWTLKASGYYFVISQRIVDGNPQEISSGTRLFISNEDSSALTHALRAESVDDIELPWFACPDPGCDFAVVVEKTDVSTQGLSDFAQGINMRTKTKELGDYRVNILYDRKISQNDRDLSLIFSGYAWVDNKFFYGSSEEINADSEEIRNSLGIFQYCHVSPNEIAVGTDRHGFGRLFYAEMEGRHLASNRYHLLLLLCRQLGWSLTWDFSKVIGAFSSNTTLFVQVYNENLLLSNTKILPSYKRILITDNGVSFEQEPLHDELCGPVPKDAAEYEQIIRDAAGQIVANVEAVLERFDSAVIDLSGGRDSRVTYAAFTNLNDNLQERCALRSTLHEPDDLSTAIGVRNLFGGAYLKEGETFYVKPLEEGANQKRSYYLGYHFLWQLPIAEKAIDERKIRMVGESFEAFSVRYYSNALRSPLRSIEVDTVVNEISTLVSRQSVLDYGIYKEYFEDILTETLDSTPGDTAQEKLDSLFLLFRGSFHAGNLDRAIYEGNVCLPLQARGLLRAKRYCLKRYNHNKVIYDILHTLNPLLAAVDFNSPKANADYRLAKPTLISAATPFRHAMLNTDKSSILDWDKAHAEKKRADKYIFEDGTEVDGTDPRVREIQMNTNTFLYEEAMRHAAYLFQKAPQMGPDFAQSVLIPSVWYMTRFTKNSDEIRIIHHKLATIRDIISILSPSQTPGS